MSEDFSNMKENGFEIGISSKDTDLQGIRVPVYEHGQKAGTPERKEQDSVHAWVNNVKTEIESGQSKAFVRDRTNFDIDEEGNISPSRTPGYQDRLLRGVLVEKTADQIRNVVDGLVSNQTYGKNKLESDEAGLPIENHRKSDTLYVTIAKVEDLPLRNYENVALQVSGQSLVEIRYKQPKADEYDRTAEKRVVLVVSNKTAEKLQSLIEQGVNPNELRDATSSIFTNEKGAAFYDANLIDRYARPDNPAVKVAAEKPELTETFLQVTKPGGKDRQVLADKKIIQPGGTDSTFYKNDNDIVSVGMSDEEIRRSQERINEVGRDVRIPKSGINDDDIVDGDVLVIDEGGSGNGSDITKIEPHGPRGETLLAKLIRGHTEVEGVGPLNNASLEWFRKNASDVLDYPEKYGLTAEDQKAFLAAWNAKTQNGSRNDSSDRPNYASTTSSAEPLPGFVPFDQEESVSDQTPSRNRDNNNRRQEQNRSRGNARMFSDDESGETWNEYDPEYRINQGIDTISPEDRERVIDDFLEKVEVEYGETSINSLPGNIGKAMRTLEGLIKRYDQDPTKEYALPVEAIKIARARIRVHDMNAALLFLNFKPDEIKGDIRNKFQQISAGGRIIDGEDLAVLLKGRIDIPRYQNLELGEKIQAGAAMNILKQAATEGIMVQSPDGEVKVLYWGNKKMSPDEIRTLNEKIKERLPDNCDKDATFRLAERVARITFEASVWDVDGSDPISQVFYMEDSRRSTIKKIESASETAVSSDDYGPGITVDMIPGFGTSLIRRASYKTEGSDVRITNNAQWRAAADNIKSAGKNEAQITASINSALAVNRVAKGTPGQPAANLPIDYTTLDYEKLPGNVFTDYYQKYLPAIKTTEAYLLKSDWKPTDFTRDKINDMFLAFGYADPGEIFYLKGTFIYGILEENLSSTAMEQSTKGTFKDAVALESFLRILVTPSPGQKVAFMTPEQLKAIRKVVRPMWRAEMQSMFDDAFGKVIKTSQ